jgi:hypothetical protein
VLHTKVGDVATPLFSSGLLATSVLGPLSWQQLVAQYIRRHFMTMREAI